MKPEPQTILLIDPPSAFASFDEIAQFIIECNEAIREATRPEVREIFEREKAEAYRNLPAAFQRIRQSRAANPKEGD